LFDPGGAILPPRPQFDCAIVSSGGQGWPRLSRPPEGLVLDGREHDGTLAVSERKTTMRGSGVHLVTTAIVAASRFPFPQSLQKCGNSNREVHRLSRFRNHQTACSCLSDLGAGHPLGFVGVFSPSAKPFLQQITRVLSRIGATLVENAGRAAADVNPMARHGVPVFGLMQDERTYFNYHHTAADTLDKIVPQELGENAAAMAVLAFALADMPQTLPRSTGSQ
jgi:hypothetical protein